MGTSLEAILVRSFQNGFPNWGSLQESCWKGMSRQIYFNMVKSKNYQGKRDEINGQFERSAKTLKRLRATALELDHIAEFTTDRMSHVVYGSNQVERAGLNLKDTLRLCKLVFEEDDFNELWHKLRAEEADLNEEIDIYTHREVSQHAQALKYITNFALNRDELLTEELIINTHLILCQGIPIKRDDGDTSYAGRYRHNIAMAGNTLFTAPENVPGCMKIFIDDFNKDIRDRQSTKSLDPFYLAADICQDFLTIHPFREGNGRMGRLIANAFLIKYAGIVISIGETEEDREEYLRIAAMAGDGEFEEEARGTLAAFFLKKGDAELQALQKELLED